MFIITFPLNKKFVFYLTIPKNRNSNQEAIRLLLLLLNPECEKCEKRISLAAISSDCVKLRSVFSVYLIMNTLICSGLKYHFLALI